MNEAYHIRTEEPKPGGSLFDFATGEVRTFDSLYFHYYELIRGFTQTSPGVGVILDYSEKKNVVIAREMIINYRTKKKIENGEVINNIEIDEEIFKKIKNCGVGFGLNVHLTEEFDGSTNSLIKILSGEIVKKNLRERIFVW